MFAARCLAVAVVVVTSIFCGCAAWEAKMETNNENLLKLQPGMTVDQVREIMGIPSFNEAYRSLNGRPVVIWFYYTQRKWADGSETKDECTPVVFESGELSGWGDEFYTSEARKWDITIRHR